MSHVAALFQQVWTHPEDDHVRLVLADALMAEGDPRGELIRLQCGTDPAREGRIMRLLQQHGMTWLGALRGAVVPTAYERGFVASCVIFDAANVIGCDEWSTVHTVELRGAEVAFAVHPVMRSLRTLAGIDGAALRWLLDHTAQLPRSLAELVLEPARAEMAWAWQRLDAVPAIRRLTWSEQQPLCVVRGSDDRLSILLAVYSSAVLSVLGDLPGDLLTSIQLRAVPATVRPALDALLARQHRLQEVSIASARPDELDDD